jgi:two-component system cell cycle response regulator DivK
MTKLSQPMLPLRVCLVEDNLTLQRLFLLLLKKSGFEVTAFDHGKPAIEWILKNKPDVVLLDIMLPDMNGADILKHLRLKMPRNLMTVALTAYANAADKEKFMRDGFDGFIPKPINPQTFIGELEEMYREVHK